MSELQFPKDPIVGQEYDFATYRYYWDGTKWKTKGIGYNPVNDLRDELVPEITNNTTGVFEALRRTYANVGLTLVTGSFEDGGILTKDTDVLLHEVSGKAYAWTGTYANGIHTVIRGTDPTAVGSGYVSKAYVIGSSTDGGGESAKEALRRSYANAGLTVKGYTDDGATLANVSDVVIHNATGKGYSWNGVYPEGGYIVVSGTDPLTNPLYVDRSDVVGGGSGGGGVGGTLYVDDYIEPGEDDNWQSIQNAINDAEASGGGEVVFSCKNYAISNTLVAAKGVLLRGPTRVDLSTNTNGSGLSTTTNGPRIIWIGGTSNSTMFEVKSDTFGECVWGGGAVDIEWNGNNTAGFGVHLNNTKYSRFRGKVRQVTFAGVQVSSANGTTSNFSMKNYIESLEFVWGVSDACKDAMGLQLIGNLSNVPATQQLCGDISGLVYNGALVRIAETDNAQFQSVHGVVQSGGSGCAVKIINAGAQPSNHNVFHYVVGPVKQDNGIIGTFFGTYNSEGGGINQLAGNGSWDGELVDYVTGRRFGSRKYKLRDVLTVPAGALTFNSGAADANFAFIWDGKALGSGVPAGFSLMTPSPGDWADGQITEVEVVVGTNGTAGGTFVLEMKLSTTTSSPATITPEKQQTTTFISPTQYSPTKCVFNLGGTPLAYSKGDFIFLQVNRLIDNPNDDTLNGMIILGVNILYRSTGPNSAGSGNYYIPFW